MERIGALITQPLPASEQPTASTAVGSLTEQHIALLWERMTMIYGHRWTSSYGFSDDGTWLRGLSDVTPEQIAVGLEKCRTSDDEWAPTLPIFRDRCLPPKVAPYHRDLLPIKLPVPNPEVAEPELAQCRAALKRNRGRFVMRVPNLVKPLNDTDFEEKQERS